MAILLGISDIQLKFMFKDVTSVSCKYLLQRQESFIVPIVYMKINIYHCIADPHQCYSN